jgi:hypothetical protein
MPEIKEDDVVNAIRWRLGIPVDSNVGQHQALWGQLVNSNDQHILDKLHRVGHRVADLLVRAVNKRLEFYVPATPNEAALLDALWAAFHGWLAGDPMRRSPETNRLIKEAVGRAPRAGSAATASTSGRPQPQATPRHLPQPTASPSGQRAENKLPANAPAAQRGGGIPPTAEAPEVAVEPDNVAAVSPPPGPHVSPSPGPSENDPPAVGDPSLPPPARPAHPQWNYKPIPKDDPDPHSEFDVCDRETTDGSLIVGARVRGKKHKHDGTNCDDWFAVELAGPWSIIAVADGAGSYRFSRVGARAACEKAVTVLAGSLGGITPQNRRSLAGIDERNEAGAFLDKELCGLQNQLYNAVQLAHYAVQEELQARRNSAAHERIVGRPLKVEDFAATLLLAAHARLRVGDTEQSLVLACQIGDGNIVAMDAQAGAHALSLPDSGGFSGETDFLTSRKQIEQSNVAKKTFAWIGPLRALLVMTDGVGDDYFPVVPEMRRLYAELALNAVVRPDRGSRELLQLPATLDVNSGELDVETDTQTAEGPMKGWVRSAERLAAALGAKGADLAACPGLLRTASLPWRPSPASDRLRWWLDSYQVRGSFDDRTLVVLHRPRAD